MELIINMGRKKKGNMKKVPLRSLEVMCQKGFGICCREPGKVKSTSNSYTGL